LLEDADEGDDIDEFEVIDEGTETFAGKQWDTVTLEATISEVKTVRVYDRDSGLMLEQTVDVADAPTVTLEKYTIPDMEAVAPPPPPPEPTPPANDTTEPANETTEPPEPELYNDTEQPDITTTDTTTVTDTTEDEEEAEPEPQGKKKCIGGAILLMLAGLVLVKR
jgi:hypothetical protein